jgi:transcription antitermination factor NusG
MEQSIFCGVCKTGDERETSNRLIKIGVDMIPSEVERIIVKNGKSATEKRPKMPGYLFLAAEGEPDWTRFRK